MSKNINQIFVANPAAAMAATDLLYLGRSPFGAANDMAITWSNMMASITVVGTITSGTWNGTVIAMQYGGSGKNLTANNGGIVWTDADSMEVLAGTATAGKVLQSGATATPSWSTPTYPSASGTAGQVIRSDGTNNLYSTFTIPDTAAINTIPYASSANVYGAITPVNSALLISSAGGVPSWSNTAIPGFIMAGGIDMNSQTLTNVPTPSANGDAANKQYVDTTALNGTSVYAATAAGLTVTQAGAGPGATLTNAGAMAAFSIDGVSPPAGVNVLVKDIAAGGTAANYGIYTVTTVGSGAANWVLTRATSFDTATEINNTGLIVINNGSTLAGKAWYNTATIVTVDTTNFVFVQFSSSTLSVTKQVFTANGTYTPTTGMAYCIVEVVGGGGGGGGIAATAAGESAASSGGGGGGYARKIFTAATIGASQAVTVGAGGTAGAAGANDGGTGGTTSLGALLSATGGTGGAGSNSAAFGAAFIGSATNGLAGTGGVGSSGDFNSKGAGGLNAIFGGTTLGGSFTNAGAGGNSVYGGGAPGPVSNNDGVAGGDYGGGGSGAANNASQSSRAGGAGAAGLVYITEFVLT